MKAIAVMSLLLLSQSVIARTTATEWVWLSVQAMDWAQTRTIAANPDRFYETNVILGRHPSKTAVDVYFLATTISVIAINRLLSKRRSMAWMTAVITVQLTYVMSNHSLGIGVSW